MPRRAFTLIELLVVITIIVVLLALLTPALDKAIYSAEMAREAAGQDVIVTGAITYATGNKKGFPRNINPRDGGFQPDLVGWKNETTRDIRPICQEYIPTKMFQCPLAFGELDFSIDGNWPDTQVFSNYYILFGWQWTRDFGGAGRFRLGDRLGFIDNLDNNKTYRSRVMVMDRHLTHNLEITQVTHPDKDGVLPGEAHQNAPYTPVALAVGTTSALRFTFSVHQGGGNGKPVRGPVDLNYGMDDGSVQRLNDVLHRDERTANAPAHSDSTAAPEWKVQIPVSR